MWERGMCNEMIMYSVREKCESEMCIILERLLKKW